MIVVCSLSKAQALRDEHDAGHVISLLGPDTPHRSFNGIEGNHHLRLTFHDIVQPTDGFSPPTSRDAERLIGFLGAWPRQRPLLIHCWAGISRSTAAAFTALCLLRPEASEDDLAVELRTASPSATPNRLIVTLADNLLHREGRMVRAIDSIGRGAEAFEGTPFVVRV